MDDRKSEKNSEIWLKYLEECVKSKIEVTNKNPSNTLRSLSNKETSNS